MFIVLTPKNGLEKGEKGKFLVPIAVDVADVDSFYIPIYDTYAEAVDAADGATILELPLTGEIDKLELDVVLPDEEGEEIKMSAKDFIEFALEKDLENAKNVAWGRTETRENESYGELTKEREYILSQENQEKIKSTHRVEVVPIKLEEHPNADSLSIVRVWNYQVCVQTEAWKDQKIGAYIPPDSIVPDTEQFAFLNGHNRIKVKKLRGVYSQGMMVPAPEGSKIGDDVAEQLNIGHYEPPVSSASMKGDSVPAPEGIFPDYDVESWHKYGRLLIPGEMVVVTEKIHGANSRFTRVGEQQYCGSHHQWKKEDAGNMWWRCLTENDWLTTFCQLRPELIIYGEIFGAVQNLRYGAIGGQIFFRPFDIFDKSKNAWMGFDDVSALFSDPSFGAELGNNWVPVLFYGEYNETEIRKLVDANSNIPGADHIQEGIIIQTLKERYEPEIGRVKLKIVSDQYLASK